MAERLELTINPGRVLVPQESQESEEDSPIEQETFARPDESIVSRFKDLVGFPKTYPNLAANAPWVGSGGKIVVPQLETTSDFPKAPKIAARFKAQEWLLESDMRRAELRAEIEVIENDLHELAQEIEAASLIGKAILIARSASPKKDAELKLQRLQKSLDNLEKKRASFMSARERAEEVYASAAHFGEKPIWEAE